MKLDHFVDTPLKRKSAFLLFVIGMLTLGGLSTFGLGMKLYKVEHYDALFEMLKEGVFLSNYLSRSVFSIVSATRITPISIAMSFVSSLHFFEYTCLVVCILFGLVKKGDMKYSRYIWAALFSFGISIMVCAFMVYQATLAGSLQIIILKIQAIGILFLIQSVFQLVCMLIAGYFCIKRYCKEMQIHVEYINE